MGAAKVKHTFIYLENESLAKDVCPAPTVHGAMVLSTGHRKGCEGTSAIPSLLHHTGVARYRRSRSSIGIAVPWSSIGLAGGCHIHV
ncbi:hypothetical protein Bca52824_072786 [Brassica carinata]|uniref:Uncharacterized protein n=1 Tax=Brassica carinata TaxID=52824 RepID=A0A8X7QAB4_BRACI|nr:hypothetical protein Bca52824_072786 [Brassica carinata]